MAPKEAGNLAERRGWRLIFRNFPLSFKKNHFCRRRALTSAGRKTRLTALRENKPIHTPCNSVWCRTFRPSWGRLVVSHDAIQIRIRNLGIPSAFAFGWVARMTTVVLEMVLPGLGGQWLDSRWETHYWAVAGFWIGFRGGDFPFAADAQALRTNIPTNNSDHQPPKDAGSSKTSE